VITSQPLPGTRDRYGAELRRRDYIAATLRHTAYARGFEPLAVPLLERTASFSEDVVGRSPWPEWNPLGVFTVPVTDYTTGYDDQAGTTQALLIPEGTVSVARWTAARLATLGDAALPVRVCYDLPCHRNEPVDVLTGTKLREFSQFGVEIIGPANAAADAEVVLFVHDALTALGVPAGAIRVRLNDVAIFRKSAADSGLAHEAAIAVKELLDALAECRAGKQPERRDNLAAALAGILDGHQLTSEQRRRWELMARHDTGWTDPATRRILGPAYTAHLDQLQQLRDQLAAAGLTVAVDLGVVRSHEYYTGVSFEVDVVDGGTVHTEIAGGGRYDKLIAHFTDQAGPASVPATGFAFGMERLAALLAGLGAFDVPAQRQVEYRFDHAAADQLLIPTQDAGTVAGYLRARAAATPGKRTDIWVGEAASEEQVAAYASARGIGEVIWC
jgi:histidyl-tRNA synthetase